MTKNIMIIDGAAVRRQTIHRSLKRAGYTVIEACNGSEALRKLGGQRVALIISDVDMPSGEADRFLRGLQMIADCKHTPVMMLDLSHAPDQLAGLATLADAGGRHARI